MENKHPIQIYREVSAKYPDWLEWEPESLLLTYPEGNQDKLLAVQTVAKNPNAVTRKSFIFEKVVICFNNGQAIMDAYTKPFIEEVYYAVGQIKKIISEVQEIPEEEIEFSGDIPQYVAAVAHTRGWVVMPRKLQWSQEALSAITGASPGSRRYKDHYKVLKAIREAINAFPEEMDIADMSTEILEKNRNSLILKYIGAALYDPTIDLDEK